MDQAIKIILGFDTTIVPDPEFKYNAFYKEADEAGLRNNYSFKLIHDNNM
jgi:hypothetical protein